MPKRRNDSDQSEAGSATSSKPFATCAHRQPDEAPHHMRDDELMHEAKEHAPARTHPQHREKRQTARAEFFAGGIATPPTPRSSVPLRRSRLRRSGSSSPAIRCPPKAIVKATSTSQTRKPFSSERRTRRSHAVSTCASFRKRFALDARLVTSQQV